VAGREHLLPDPRQAADDLAALDERPELPPEPSSWIVRQVPEPAAEVA
jgi:hypothetical protein